MFKVEISSVLIIVFYSALILNPQLKYDWFDYLA